MHSPQGPLQVHCHAGGTGRTFQPPGAKEQGDHQAGCPLFNHFPTLPVKQNVAVTIIQGRQSDLFHTPFLLPFPPTQSPQCPLLTWGGSGKARASQPEGEGGLLALQQGEDRGHQAALCGMPNAASSWYVQQSDKAMNVSGGPAAFLIHPP